MKVFRLIIYTLIVCVKQHNSTRRDIEQGVNMRDFFTHIKHIKSDDTVINYNLFWKTYHSLYEFNYWIKNLQKNYPEWVTILKLGYSFEGREIIGIKLDIPYCVCEKNGTLGKKSVYMESNIHAREWISSAASTLIIFKLIQSQPGSELYRLARNYIWYFIPIANPDGFFYTHSHPEKKVREWRKTRRPTSNPNCTGTDLNRNFPHAWRMNKDGPKGRAKECLDDYPGEQPLSEPEARVMYNFLNQIGPDLHAFFSFHAYAQAILLPYGEAEAHLDNYDEMMKIGKKAIEVLERRYGTKYSIDNAYNVMCNVKQKSIEDSARRKGMNGPVSNPMCEKNKIGWSGNTMDYVKATFHTPIVLTYELRPTYNQSGYRFQLPEDQIIGTALETLDSMVLFFVEYDKLHPTPKNLSCKRRCEYENTFNDYFFSYGKNIAFEPSLSTMRSDQYCVLANFLQIYQKQHGKSLRAIVKECSKYANNMYK